MGKKKNQVKNSFYCFMMEYQSKSGQRFANMKALVEATDKLWRKMGPEEREPYVRKSKIEKNSEDGKQENENVPKHKNMRDCITETIQYAAAGGFIADQPFFIIHMNHFCFCNSTDQYIPAELAVCKFTLRNGVTPENVFHEIIKPGPIPLGYKFDAKQQSAETHQLEVPDNEEPNNLEEVLCKLIEFIKERTENASIPPIYAKDHNKAIVENILQNLCIKYCYDKNLFTIHSLEYMFFVLRNSVSDSEPYPTVSLSQIELEKDVYDFCKQIPCNYHQISDVINYCSRSYVIRLAYVICDNCCSSLNIDLIRGQHIPHDSLLNASRLMRDDESDFSDDTDWTPACQRNQCTIRNVSNSKLSGTSHASLVKTSVSEPTTSLSSESTTPTAAVPKNSSTSTKTSDFDEPFSVAALTASFSHSSVKSTPPAGRGHGILSIKSFKINSYCPEATRSEANVHSIADTRDNESDFSDDTDCTLACQKNRSTTRDVSNSQLSGSSHASLVKTSVSEPTASLSSESTAPIAAAVQKHSSTSIETSDFDKPFSVAASTASCSNLSVKFTPSAGRGRGILSIKNFKIYHSESIGSEANVRSISEPTTILSSAAAVSKDSLTPTEFGDFDEPFLAAASTASFSNLSAKFTPPAGRGRGILAIKDFKIYHSEAIGSEANVRSISEPTTILLSAAAASKDVSTSTESSDFDEPFSVAASTASFNNLSMKSTPPGGRGRGTFSVKNFKIYCPEATRSEANESDFSDDTDQYTTRDVSNSQLSGTSNATLVQTSVSEPTTSLSSAAAASRDSSTSTESSDFNDPFLVAGSIASFSNLSVKPTPPGGRGRGTFSSKNFKNYHSEAIGSEANVRSITDTRDDVSDFSDDTDWTPECQRNQCTTRDVSNLQLSGSSYASLVETSVSELTTSLSFAAAASKENSTLTESSDFDEPFSVAASTASFSNLSGKSTPPGGRGRGTFSVKNYKM